MRIRVYLDHNLAEVKNALETHVLCQFHSPFSHASCLDHETRLEGFWQYVWHQICVAHVAPLRLQAIHVLDKDHHALFYNPLMDVDMLTVGGAGGGAGAGGADSVLNIHLITLPLHEQDIERTSSELAQQLMAYQARYFASGDDVSVLARRILPN